MAGERLNGGGVEHRILILLCGLAFAGKSTLAQRLVERRGGVIVSPDEINARRGLYGGDGVPDHEWARTHEVALSEIAGLMRDGVAPIVVDETCCFRFLRDDYREVAERHGYRAVLVVLDVPLAEVKRRMRENTSTRARRGLEPEVFEQHRSSFEWPQDDEERLVYKPADDLDRWLTTAQM